MSRPRHTGKLRHTGKPRHIGKPRPIDWSERLDPGANARRRLPQLVADYFAAVRGWLKGDPGPSALHQARLASKHVRYTLELFRPCYGPGLEARLAALRRVQQVLGEVNDAAATGRLLDKAQTAEVPHHQLAVKFLEARAEAKAQEFRQEWTEVFDAPGQLQWWTGYLAHYGRTPGRKA
ncbi:MAG TPA: CHAD domain-containing protein [Candidatus Acidoferrales bacterium]|jgi:CHAD domain-containing protein|nr:CHAD domain-containing protein [Candidatus Acidoferrales bacterium]